MSVTVNTRPTNGVSWSVKHTITAAEVADGTIIFDFQADVPLTAVVQILGATDLLVDDAGVEVTFPANGQVQITDASTPVLVEDGSVLIQASRVSAES